MNPLTAQCEILCGTRRQLASSDSADVEGAPLPAHTEVGVSPSVESVGALLSQLKQQLDMAPGIVAQLDHQMLENLADQLFGQPAFE